MGKTQLSPQTHFQGDYQITIIRFHRICSEQSVFCCHENSFSQHGCPRSFLRRILKSFFTPTNHPASSSQHRDKIISLVAHFPHQSVQCIEREFFKFLIPSQYLQKHKSIPTHRRNWNLSDMLEQNRLSAPLPQGQTVHMPL